MGAKRKYPKWPDWDEKEVPYDTEHFKLWLVSNECKAVSTAESYVSSIRTAFSVLFGDDDPIFRNLRIAFASGPPNSPKYAARLEDEYETLEAYLWAIDKFGDVTLDEFNSNLKHGETKSAPKSMWVTAFQAYIRYTRWRIDNLKSYWGIPFSIEDNSNLFINIPLSRQYRLYLKNLGAGYTRNSIDTYYNKLKRLYNLLFRRRLKKDVFPMLEDYVNKRIDVSVVCNKLKGFIDEEIEIPRFDDLSLDDLTRGKYAFQLYCDFLKDYAKNPEKYPSEKYFLQ